MPIADPNSAGEAGVAAAMPMQLIAEARDAIGRAQHLLLEPTCSNIDLSCASLAMAIGRIQSLQAFLAESPGRHDDLIASAAGLRSAITGVAVLLDRAASFHANLLQRMLEAARSEDQVTAVPAEPATRVLLSV